MDRTASTQRGTGTTQQYAAAVLVGPHRSCLVEIDNAPGAAASIGVLNARCDEKRAERLVVGGRERPERARAGPPAKGAYKRSQNSVHYLPKRRRRGGGPAMPVRLVLLRPWVMTGNWK